MTTNKKRIKDLVEMMNNPEGYKYMGEEIDAMDIYDEELALLEEEEINEYAFEEDIEDIELEED